jgi:hypothetical protein
MESTIYTEREIEIKNMALDLLDASEYLTMIHNWHHSFGRMRYYKTKDGEFVDGRNVVFSTNKIKEVEEKNYIATKEALKSYEELQMKYFPFKDEIINSGIYINEKVTAKEYFTSTFKGFEFHCNLRKIELPKPKQNFMDKIIITGFNDKDKEKVKAFIAKKLGI